MARKKRKLTAQHKARLSASLMGRKFSAKTIAKMSIASSKRIGPLAANWQGGLTSTVYSVEFTKKFRAGIRSRDKERCQLCDAPQMEFKRKLCVHHIDYDKFNADPVNLITLCARCHSRTNFNRSHWTAVFKEMMIKKDISHVREDGSYGGQ